MRSRAADVECASGEAARRLGAPVRRERVAGGRAGGRLGGVCGAGAAALLIALGLATGADGAISFLNATEQQQAWCAARRCAPAAVYDVVVGQEIALNITALDDDRTRTVSIAVLADPGLPNGARLFPHEDQIH
ncbi:hypothetical protein T484DRAFT_1883108 [Baffinella frigidus]|nr:hypothetical protein T484DRAFT_1883108 [Cryptophyta sp. CCMP2293]